MSRIASNHLNDLAQDLPRVVQALQQTGINKIIWIHGTFAGDEFGGFFRQLSNYSPLLSKRLRYLKKLGVDKISGQYGNFPETYIKTVDEIIQSVGAPSKSPPITSNRFSWSGENHHIGRLDGVFALIDHLNHLSKTMAGGERILLIAHSHGGNLLAMLTLLARADRKNLVKFFRHIHQFRSRQSGNASLKNKWEAAESFLLSDQELPEFDVITLGTPLRYRWSLRPGTRLLHIINHRSLDAENPDKAHVPLGRDTLHLSDMGDVIQQLGLGGSDFPPNLLSHSERKLERKLARIFESTVRRKDYFRKLAMGRRDSSDGKTLLIDYSEIQPSEASLLLGHGVYTLESLIPFHLAIAASELCEIASN